MAETPRQTPEVCFVLQNTKLIKHQKSADMFLSVFRLLGNCLIFYSLFIYLFIVIAEGER